MVSLNTSDLVFWVWAAGDIPRVGPPAAAVLEAVVAEVELHPPTVDPTEQYKIAMRRRLNQKTTPAESSGANGTVPDFSSHVPALQPKAITYEAQVLP